MKVKSVGEPPLKLFCRSSLCIKQLFNNGRCCMKIQFFDNFLIGIIQAESPYVLETEFAEVDDSLLGLDKPAIIHEPAFYSGYH